MKKGFTHIFKYIPVIILVTVFSITNWSCRKKDSTCYALITVTDAGGASVSGVDLHVHAQSVGGDVEAFGVTDAAGQASFSFKLQAIFNVDATKGPLTGSGIVKLEPGQTVEKTIIIQ